MQHQVLYQLLRCALDNTHTHASYIIFFIQFGDDIQTARQLRNAKFFDKSYTRLTHTRLTALFPELPERAGTRKVKPIWILLKQETVSGNGISWATCKYVPRSSQITMPAPHHSVFRGQMPFLPPNQQCQSTESLICFLIQFGYNIQTARQLRDSVFAKFFDKS